MISDRFTAVINKYGPRLIVDLSLTTAAAAAIFGNLAHESMGFSALQELKPMIKGSKGGYGWAQWTGPRRRAFEAFCQRTSVQPSSDEANYAFLLIELKGTEKAALHAVDGDGSLHDMVIAFEMAYERAGIKHYDSRLMYAQKAFALLEAIINFDAIPGAAPKVPKIERPKPVSVPHIDKPMVESKTNWTAGAMAMLTGATTFFSTLNPYVQGMIILAVIAGVMFIVFERYKKARAVRETAAMAAAS